MNENQTDDVITSVPDEHIPIEALPQDDEVPESLDVSEEAPNTPQGFRKERVREIPSGPGVYALCDLDGVPLYVGQSVDGIQARVRRHLTSARSDIIANRMVDIWEVSSVMCWEVRPPRMSFAKHRDSQVDADSWNEETSQAVQTMKGQHLKDLEAFEAHLPLDQPKTNRKKLVAKFRGDQKTNIFVYKSQRAEELRKEKKAFEANYKEDWEATRKAETQELKAMTDPLEAYLYCKFNSNKLLMNAKKLVGAPTRPSLVPDVKTVMVMLDATRHMRLDESLRLSRQAGHFSSLLDHILNVKNNHILRGALRAHYTRLSEYCKKFVGDVGDSATLNK